MDEILRQVVMILRGVWHRRWIGLAVAWLVALGGAVVLLRIPDRYEATARIYVDTQSVLKPLMHGLTVQPNIEQQIVLLSRTLISRPNMEKLMRMSDLDLLASTTREKDAVIDALMRQVTLTGTGRDNIYTVSYRNVDPQRARRVVQNLVSMFVESGLGDKRRDTESARKFINEQIAQYEQKLRDAENRRKEFQLRNFGFTGGVGQDYLSRLTQATTELKGVQLELRAAEQSRDALKKELAGEEPALLPETPTSVVSRHTLELDSRIDAQQKQLDELLRRYTEQHPDVLSVQRLIKQLQDERQREIEAQKKEATSNVAKSTATNPVFQQIKLSLAEAEANLASLRARASDLTARVADLRAAADRVPAVEAEMTQLNRDYDILRRAYDQLVERRESASMTEDIDQSQGLADFRVIDPPRASQRPVFPDRRTLVPLVLAAAMAAGAFAAFAVAQVFPIVDSSKTLRQLSSRPVLGTVSMLVNAQMLRRRRISNTAFGSAVAGLFLIYGAWIGWIAVTSQS
jgi:polysaccharide chain length determinant protein (PEP-CTERM system associated)